MSEQRSPLNIETMTVDEFQQHLPEFFATGNGRMSEDPRFAKFLAENPTCMALVNDLEYIAEAARQMLEPVTEEPSDAVWSNIQSRLKIAAVGDEPQ